MTQLSPEGNSIIDLSSFAIDFDASEISVDQTPPPIAPQDPEKSIRERIASIREPEMRKAAEFFVDAGFTPVPENPVTNDRFPKVEFILPKKTRDGGEVIVVLTSYADFSFIHIIKTVPPTEENEMKITRAENASEALRLIGRRMAAKKDKKNPKNIILTPGGDYEGAPLAIMVSEGTFSFQSDESAEQAAA